MPSVAAVCLIPIALREEKVPSSRYTQARRARKGWMRAMVLGTMCSVLSAFVQRTAEKGHKY